MMQLSFLENVIRRAEHGESILQASYNTAGEISLTILSMTLSLAACFHSVSPLARVTRPHLPGIFHHHYRGDSRVRSCFSDADALMCARILGERRAGHKRARMENGRAIFIKRVIDVYSRALDKFLDRAWLTIPILLTCILGLWFFFTHLPFTLLPPGDSGFARGVFIAQEGSSPEQMRAFQKLVNEKIEGRPECRAVFSRSPVPYREAPRRKRSSFCVLNRASSAIRLSNVFCEYKSRSIQFLA